LKPSKINEIST